MEVRWSATAPGRKGPYYTGDMRGSVSLLLLVLQLATCAAAPAAPAAEDRVIVAFGDSLTAGLGVDRKSVV